MARNRSKMGRSESPDTAERHRKLNILDLSTELLQGITSKLNLNDRWSLSFANRRLRGITSSEPPAEIKIPLYPYEPRYVWEKQLNAAPVKDSKWVERQQTAAKHFLRCYSKGRPLLGLRFTTCEFVEVPPVPFRPLNLVAAKESVDLIRKFLHHAPELQSLQIDALLGTRRSIAALNNDLQSLKKLVALTVQHNGGWQLEDLPIQHLKIECAFDAFQIYTGTGWAMVVNSLPCLETLSIKFQAWPTYSSGRDERILDFETLPRLQFISMECAILDGRLRWQGQSQSVTDLYLGDIWMQGPNLWFSSISTSLRRLYLWKFGGGTREPCTVDFSNLEILELWHCYPSFLKNARFPRLQHCSITAFPRSRDGIEYGLDSPFAVIESHIQQLETIFIKFAHTSAEEAQDYRYDINVFNLIQLLLMRPGQLRSLYVDEIPAFEEPETFHQLFAGNAYRYTPFEPNSKIRTNQRAKMLQELDKDNKFLETRYSKTTATDYETIDTKWLKSYEQRRWKRMDDDRQGPVRQ